MQSVRGCEMDIAKARAWPVSKMGHIKTTWPAIVIFVSLVVFLSDGQKFFKVYSSNAPAIPSSFLGDLESGDFQLAFDESAGYFDDIRESDWKLIKARINNTPNCASECEPEEPPTWYQNNWEPAISCQHERRIGALGDGGKWVCDPHRILNKPSKSCLVYSIGSNNEFTFEKAIRRDISSECEVHTFDPTVGNHPSNLPKNENITFHPWGLGATNQGAYKNLNTIINELGHAGKEIDIFKIDCEGCEFETVRSWFGDGSVAIRQILLEIHKGTEGAQPPPTQELMLFLESKGFVIFHKEPNIQYGGGLCIEYAFLRLRPPLRSAS